MPATTPSALGAELGKDAAALIVHVADPLQAELGRAFIGQRLVTPYPLFFVRNHLALPRIDEPDAFTIRLEGVARPGAVTVADLRRMPQVVTPVVLQCAGNGRAYFPNEQSGALWRLGAAGLGVWGGVLLSEVATHFGGPVSGTKFLTVTGCEQVDPHDRAERSIPIGKALRDVLLAVELNGGPLPIAHGGPVRLIVPGYYAINSVKYPSRVAFTVGESAAPIMANDYRISAVGSTRGVPTEPTCWAMNVKSWITSPLGDRRLSPGRVRITGVALAGENAVEHVEITTNGGLSWSDAELVGPDLGPAAWRQFSHTFHAAAGAYTLASRATDAAGNVQPEHLVPNRQGYQANGWREPAVTVAVED